jgi:hypothetical protein
MRLRIGPPLVCLILGLTRAVWLSVQLSTLNATEVGFLLLADIPVLGALMVLLWLEAALAKRWRIVALVLAILLTIIYVADVATVMALNARLQLEDIGRFGVEWWLLPAFLDVRSVIVLAVLIAAFFIRVRVSAVRARFVVTAAVFLWIAPMAVQQGAISPHLHKYTGSVLGLGRGLLGLRSQPMPRYTVGDYEAYRQSYEGLLEAPITASRKSIVLIIVESLSAADSARTSGLGNLLGRFDELSRKGMLFRNFFANFEASEGGIVSLLSGVPPLHFPTASTSTFGEYALQRSITAEVARDGYRNEFLTTVPLGFLSMHRYMTSPTVGFRYAGGQDEIARYQSAPRYAFESPADHLLYEELLYRLGTAEQRRQEPVFLAAVTASSHAPYIDPLGRENSAAQAWAYVQDELWWLYGELLKRGFFDNGLLIITGDHRKMLPITGSERERYGDGAKARVPLVVIGKGIPENVVDDRLFQQSDLLRMLDRLPDPSVDLSPFAMWVERYVYVFGVAANASRVEIFLPDDQGRRGYQLNLKGAEIEWINPPRNAVAIEGAIHRQRVAQQAQRAAIIGPDAVNFGRELHASDAVPGVLIGVSTDVDPRRDPDDPRGALKLFTARSFSPDDFEGSSDAPFTVTTRGFLPVQQDGEYWFSAFSPKEVCLAIDKRMVLGCRRGLHEGGTLLTRGLHRFDYRYVHQVGAQLPDLKWLPPGAQKFTPFPQQILLLPKP